MPLYDYKCSGCGVEYEGMNAIKDRYEVSCPSCGCLGASILLSTPRVALFKEGWYNNVGTEPVYCETPQQLRNACDAEGLKSVYLEDSVFKTEAKGEYVEAAAERRRQDYPDSKEISG